MWPGSPLERRLAERLAAWSRAGLRRTRRTPDGVDLSSNDYLQLARHPDVVRAFARGALEEGVGSSGSRLLRGERTIFDAVEQRVAAWKGSDRALFFSSGYLANLAVLTTLTERDDLIISDALNHASLIDGARLAPARREILPHADLDALETRLRQADGPGVRFVVTESVFSMDGDLAPLRELVALCHRYGAVPVVDEAHACGLYGDHGSGRLEAAGVDPRTCISINTAGKALGVSGAFVTGPSAVIEMLTQRARPFVFSTAPPPAVAHAIAASLDLVAREPDRRATVAALARYLRGRLRAHGVTVPADGSQIIPIHVGANGAAVRLAARLSADGFDVRAIRPPTVPDGTARLRISVNAGLDVPTLDRFAAAVAEARQEVSCAAASS
ncbi:MAG: aminotransferase class I/II-fold pyridoxal phosphate-dependent enzyme [Vicinamibacterales bacterium]